MLTETHPQRYRYHDCENGSTYKLNPKFTKEILIVSANQNSLKYVSLITLTLQNAILGLSMRYGRTRSGDMFLSSTGNSAQNFKSSLQSINQFTSFQLCCIAVVMSEFVKLLTCLVLVFYEEGQDVNRLLAALHTTIVKNPVDTFKICVPSLVYIIQNNLLYLSASHLDAATYQVNYYL